jgi:uncharacterized protein
MPVILKNKIVLISGASSGFGADTARLFGQEGAVVLLVARRLDKLTAVGEEIKNQGGQAHVFPMDVTDFYQRERLVRQIIDEFGRIDILYNNAGFGRLNWLEELDPQKDIQAQIDVNLSATIQLTRLVLPHMYRQGSGHVINMASMAGQIASPLYTIYAATKHGVRGFTNALRREAEACGVRVSGIYPIGAETEFSQHTGDNPFKRNVKLPAFLRLTSVGVARRIVRLAKHPQRTVIMPGYFRPVMFFEYIFPGLVDWILNKFFVERHHHPR